MTTVDTPAAAPAPAEPKPNSFARIFGVLFSPEATFASIARRPTWVAPFLVLVVMALVSGLVLASRLDFAAPVREQMESRKDIPPEQVDRAVRIATAMGKVIPLTAPLFMVIGLLIVAGILLLAFRLFGGEGTFGQAWAAVNYASMPSVIKTIIILIVVLAKGGAALNPALLPTLVRSNPAFLFDPKTQAMAYAFTANFDVFSIWVLVLMIIAFAHLARVSKAKSAAIVISLWLVKCVVTLIGPAMQSLRK